ncbi:hypothetical protein [Rhizobium etli]|uniref:hypothetical protein n=1 Tax=Rhizobium etli TaxID=29449 RepID=UPI000A32A7BB|nr:hypothetical protein [Rhizobium etli]
MIKHVPKQAPQLERADCAKRHGIDLRLHGNDLPIKIVDGLEVMALELYAATSLPLMNPAFFNPPVLENSIS